MLVCMYVRLQVRIPQEIAPWHTRSLARVFVAFVLLCGLTAVCSAERLSLDEIAKQQASSSPRSSSSASGDSASSDRQTPETVETGAESHFPSRVIKQSTEANRFRSQLASICEQLDLDERRPDMVAALSTAESQPGQNEDVKPFLRAFQVSCRGARNGRLGKLKADRTGKIMPKAERRSASSEPLAAVIDRVSAVAIELAEDHSASEAARESFGALCRALRSNPDPRTREYFDIFCAFFLAPFGYDDSSEAAAALPTATPMSVEEKKQKLDELF